MPLGPLGSLHPGPAEFARLSAGRRSAEHLPLAATALKTAGYGSAYQSLRERSLVPEAKKEVAHTPSHSLDHKQCFAG